MSKTRASANKKNDSAKQAAPKKRQAKKPTHRVYISLGSNLGDRADTLLRGVDAMVAAGIRVVRKSSLYETEPADAPPQPWFRNAVVEAETQLTPRQLLRALAKIELAFGRRRTVFRGPRTLDLDILLYGTSVIRAGDLVVPHAGLPDRRFVLVPLVELVPALEHPTLRKDMTSLLAQTADRSDVRVFRDANWEHDQNEGKIAKSTSGRTRGKRSK